MRREDGETCACGLVLIRRAQRPECNGSTAELSEPTLELRLCGVVGQATHVEDLASLGQKGTHVGAGVHGLGEYVGVLLWGLAFADQAAKYPGKRHSLFHSPPWRGGGQCLQVKGQVVLDGLSLIHI